MRIRRTILALLGALVLAGCGGEDESAAPPATTTELDRRCQLLPPAIAGAIESGLSQPGKQRLRFGYAVRSHDFESVYFISADVEGKGLAGRDDIGTWAANNISYGGAMFAVNAFAKKVSAFGDGAKFTPRLTMKNEGARLSTRCVKELGG